MRTWCPSIEISLFGALGSSTIFVANCSNMQSQSKGFLSLPRILCKSFLTWVPAVACTTVGQHSVLGQSWI